MAVPVETHSDDAVTRQAPPRGSRVTRHPTAFDRERMGTVSHREWRWCLGAAALVMALTCLPYLWLWRMTPPGHTFPGFLVSLADQCVYMAWMKEAAEGHFFLRSLWTNAPQQGLNVHLLFWLLGIVARVTALPLPIVYHGARLLLGGAVLVLFYRLTAFFTAEVSARRTALGLAAFSAGFGWLSAAPYLQGPVDTWQTEAITWQALYSNALFCAGLALILAVVGSLVAAERTGQRRWAVTAGLAGALLANIHSYDVFTVVAVWGIYLITRALTERRLPLRSLGDSAVAALIALPAVAYQLYVYTHEPVFRQRAALTLTPSGEWWKLVLGYGLLVPLAVGGAWALLGKRRVGESRAYRWLPVVWAVVGFLVPYLPFSFQRKLGMGLHLPLALLAGIGLTHLAQSLTRRLPRRQAGNARGALVVAVIALTMPTNVLKLVREVRLAVHENWSENRVQPAYWEQSELAAMAWADQHLEDEAVIQALTVTATLIPPFAGRRVWAGHWSETPGFEEKLYEVVGFFATPLPPAERLRFLRERGISHLLFGPRERAWDQRRGGYVEPQLRSAPFLVPLHTAGEGSHATTIYAVRPPG